MYVYVLRPNSTTHTIRMCFMYVCVSLCACVRAHHCLEEVGFELVGVSVSTQPLALDGGVGLTAEVGIVRDYVPLLGLGSQFSNVSALVYLLIY